MAFLHDKHAGHAMRAEAVEYRAEDPGSCGFSSSMQLGFDILPVV
jgi:hypothetical protein